MMTQPFGDPNAQWGDGSEPQDYFDAEAAQGHLLIVKVHDVATYFRTRNNPDGMVHPTRGATWEPFPNSVVRASVVDLNVAGDDGALGKVFAEVVIFPSSLTKIMKTWPGKGMRLLVWNKTGPKQTDPYAMMNMAGNEQAAAAANDFLTRHPEFDQIPAPEPYDGKPPQQQPVYQGAPPPYGTQQGPPQGYGQQPGWQADPWGSQVPQQQYGPPQGQQPGWNAPQIQQYMNQMPPQGPPPNQGWQQPPQNQQQPVYQGPPQQSFLARTQGQPDPYGDPSYTQHPPQGQGQWQQGQSRNHHGAIQPNEPPY
jgi:hypothetical protein